MICQVSLGVKLFFNFHLIQQISRSGIFVHDEENVADVDNDTALVIGEILDVAADSFPIAVEIDTDQFTVCIHHRATGVPTGRMGGCAEGNWHFSVGSFVASEIFGSIQFFQAGWYYEFPVGGIFLFHHSVQCCLMAIVVAVARAVPFYLSVGEAQGKVGVGKIGTIAVHGQQTFYITTVSHCIPIFKFF